MTESIIADFAARFIVDSRNREEPISGRVLLSRKRLVLATGDDKATIPLTSIFDISVGHVPPNVTEFFDDTVTIGYTRDGTQRTAMVEGEAEVIDRFSTILFKAQLNGAQATVRHPARVGGRVVDSVADIATLTIGNKQVTFKGLDDPVTIDLATVIDFEKDRRTINDKKQLSLMVRHMDQMQSVTTEITLPSSRKMNILGRYLRLEYSDLMNQLQEVEVSDSEMELLVGLYSSGDMDADLAQMLGVDASKVSVMIDKLESKGLVVRSSGATELTSMGRLMIGNRLEDINI